MRVQFNTLGAVSQHQVAVKNVKNSASVPMTSNDIEFMPSAYYAPIQNDTVSPVFKANVINFTGGKEKAKRIFVGAELPPYWKAGGVATVMKDYASFGDPMVIPYYNGKLEYDSQTGLPTGKVEVLKDKAGNPIFTNKNLDEISYDELMELDDKGKKKYVELETVARKTMAWGDEEASEIVLYKVKDTNHYMIYTDLSAKMREVYKTEDGYEYASKVVPSRRAAVEAAEAATDMTQSGWKGTYDAKFAKAFVELFPVTGYPAETVVCSDAQMAYVPHYMQQKVSQNDPFWTGTKPTYVAHNLGDGYTSVISNKDMFVNLGATPNDIKKVQVDPEYLKSFHMGGGEENYFKKYIGNVLDARGQACNVMIPIRLREDGYLAAFTTVSELYGDSVATNPEVSPGLYKFLNKLKEEGKFTGILNALDDPGLAFDKPIGLKFYGNPVTLRLKDGSEKTLPAFEVFSKDMNVEQVAEVKRKNKINFLTRLLGNVVDEDMDKIAGLPDKKLSLLGQIDQKWIDKLEKGEDIKLAVFWGRGDKQKAPHNVLDAFAEFAKSEEGKNWVFVTGGDLGADQATEDAVRSRMKLINSDPQLKGRFVNMVGFAPGMPMASAGDAAVFPSTGAPCELTDLEAMKKWCNAIVTDLQGLSQKNFDPRRPAEAAKATGYKTNASQVTSIEELKEISPAFKAEYDKMMNKELRKLKLRGVADNLAQKLAKENVEAHPKFEELRKLHTDAATVDDLVECLKQLATRPKDLEEKMLQNMKEIKTGGWENGALHPDGLSTWEKYQKLHFDPDPVAPKLNLAAFLDTLVAKSNEIKQEAAEAVSNAVNDAKAGTNKSRVGWIIGGVAAVALAVGGVMKYKKDQAEKAEMEKDPSLVA